MKVKVKDKDFIYVIFIIIIVSFLGFVLENITKLLSGGYADNRYLILPFILPYGLAILVMYIFFGKTNSIRIFNKKIFKNENKINIILSNILYFLTASFITFVGELIVGNLFDFLVGVELWDYSNHKLHFTKYTCLEFNLAFGAIIYLFMKFLFYPLLIFLKKHIHVKLALKIDYILGSLIVLDTLIMIIYTLVNKEPFIWWKFKI